MMETLTRKEAAKELMVSEITVDKFVSQNLLEPASIEPVTGKAVFDKEQVAALKEQRSEERIEAFNQLRKMDDELDHIFDNS